MTPHEHTTEVTIEIEESDSGAHDYTITSGEIGGRERPRANFACPRCDRELTPGAWSSWVCWACGDVIYVEGGESR